MKHLQNASVAIAYLLLGSVAAAERTAEDIFAPAREIGVAMQVEAAIARAQATHGVIGREAAREISAKAGIENAPPDEVAAANDRLKHRMEALLYVWRLRLSEEAQTSLHFGVTTVDVYDTVLSLQVDEATAALVGRLDDLQLRLIALAQAHRDTPMAGRTLGQHALPMTFGKKVAVFVGEIDRHRERLCQARERVRRSAILKGPVGSYAGLGDKARLVEKSFARELGFKEAYADDWHGARDVYAEVALDIALLSRSFARLGQEIFLLQSTDVGEVVEALAPTQVSSSSMPQKVNPSRSEALMHYGRTLPRQAEVLLDDVVNFYERDNTARPNAALGALFIEADDMMTAAEGLVERLHVDKDAMRANLDRTGALMRAQAVALELAPLIGRTEAADAVKAAAQESRERGVDFIDVLHGREDVGRVMTRDSLAALLDPLADLSGAGEQVDAVIEAAEQARRGSCAAK